MSLQDDAGALVVGITQILPAGLILDVAVSPAALCLPQEDDAVVKEAVHVRGSLTQKGEQIYFQGRISGVIAVTCSRCLERVHTDFATETRVVFLPPTFEVPAGESVVNDLDLYIHDGVALDLRPLVREQVVLSFPVQPLCREDCAGLCQVCGGNRNVERCTCQASSDDPRLAVLRQFRLPESS